MCGLKKLASGGFLESWMCWQNGGGGGGGGNPTKNSRGDLTSYRLIILIRVIDVNEEN